MATTPEGKVKAAIKKYLTSIGAYFFSPIGGPFTVHGVPDLICCWRGLFFGIEVKRTGNLAGATDNQKAHLAAITAAGGIGFVADSVETVKAIFGTFKDAN